MVLTAKDGILDTLQYTTTVTLIEKDQKFSVVAMENDNG